MSYDRTMSFGWTDFSGSNNHGWREFGSCCVCTSELRARLQTDPNVFGFVLQKTKVFGDGLEYCRKHLPVVVSSYDYLLILKKL